MLWKVGDGSIRTSVECKGLSGCLWIRGCVEVRVLHSVSRTEVHACARLESVCMSVQTCFVFVIDAFTQIFFTTSADFAKEP